ncbi:MAG: hypothetical protein WCW27_02035 [Patescibacteria group bacterium]|jgi:hypothetical protein
MELKQELQYLKKFTWFIIGFGIITAVAAFVIVKQRQPIYTTVVDYEVSLVNRPVSADYQYGSYYDLKGAELFTQYLMSLLNSAGVIEQIYQQANVGYDITNLAKFTSQFRADQGSAQQFTVKFSRYQQAEADTLAKAMTTVLTEHAVAAQQNEAGKNLFSLTASTPVIVYEPLNPWLVAGAGLVAGWLLAGVLVYLKRYLQS